jgi:O-antigen/teichoic acid export membrane protein
VPTLGVTVVSPASPESLGQRTARAAQWRFASTVVAASLQLGVGIVLARLLTPADFGIVALASVVLGLTTVLGDLGMGAALVQRPAMMERHVRAAFTFSLLFGVAVATVVALASPLVAALMREPALTPVLRVLALGFALRSLAVVAGALLRRQLDFRKLFVIDTTSSLFAYAGLALTLAFLGYGVWSLVWGGLLHALLASTLQMAAVRHPVRPLLARAELRDLLRFGTGATMSACANYVALNGDNFVVGRWMGAASLGLYNRAYNLMNLPQTYATGVMSSVLLPAFARLQNEPERLRRGYLLSTKFAAAVTGPVMGGMVVAAPHLVPALYGPQWSGTVLPLQILCVAGYFRALYHLGGIVAQSVGRVYSEFGLQMVYAVLILTGVALGSRYGLAGVSIAVTVAILYMFVATGRLALRITAVPWSSYLVSQLPALLTTAVTCGMAVVIRWTLEAVHASSVTITLCLIAGCVAPWGIGILWQLGHQDFAPLRSRLPAACMCAVVRLQRYRRSDVAQPA